MKILHIEDDEGIRETVSLLFRVVMPEAALLSAGTGTDGVDAARYHQPDLVLLDLGLPDISGFEVIVKIRETSQVPIIVMTAMREPGTETKCFKLGANDFVQKPFHHKTLVECINRVICGDTVSEDMTV